MTDVQFDEDQEFKRSALVKEKPYFVRLVLSTGIVSTEEQANYVLLGLAVFLIIISLYIAIPKSEVTGTIQHAPGDELLVPGIQNN